MAFKPMQHTDGRSIPFTHAEMQNMCKTLGVHPALPPEAMSKAKYWNILLNTPRPNGGTGNYAEFWLDTYYGEGKQGNDSQQQSEKSNMLMHNGSEVKLTKAAMIAFLRKNGQPTGDTARKAIADYWQQIVDAGLADAAMRMSGEQATETTATHSTAAGGKLAEALREIMGDGLVVDKVKEIVRDYVGPALDAAIANLPPKRYEFVQKDGTVKTLEGVQHKMFERLLRYCSCRLNVWLAGPAGTGKTTAAKHVAKALDLPFYFNGSVDTEYKLLGFTDAQSRVVRTPFRDAWENGGVYLFDEIDGSLPPAILAVNAALAGNLCAFPDGIVAKHKDCIIIAAANTYGHGATMEYVGRMKLDAASLDRFVRIAWDNDDALELAISPNPKWTEYVQKVRAKAKAKGLKVLITPRASINGAILLNAGDSWEDAAMATMGFGLAPEQWQAIK